MTSLISISDAVEIAVAAAKSQSQSHELVAAIAAAASSIGTAMPSSTILRDALRDVLLSEIPSNGLRVMLSCGALQTLLPPITKIVALSQESGRRHKDVWEHTLAVVDGVPAQLPLRLAALLHDIGKPDTLKFVPGKGATFHNHPAVGASITKDCIRDVAQTSLASDVTWLVAHHLRPAEHSAEWTDSAVRRFIKECGPRADQLLLLSRADLTTRNPRKIQRARDNADALVSRMERVASEDAAPRALVKGFGTWLTERWGLSGREIGQVKSLIEELVERGTLPRLADPKTYETAVSEILSSLPVKDEVEVCNC